MPVPYGNNIRHEQEWRMSHFKKLADAMQFAPEKMKKNALFETDRFLCDTYCFEPGRSRLPILMPVRTKFITFWKAVAFLRWVKRSANWVLEKLRLRRQAKITASLTVGSTDW